uniref:GIY-YIG homing endonuclease n=1 Tax=Panagrolaimus sp. ES5 TaxID=591445 RepID=A0AC34GRD2_9BILA
MDENANGGSSAQSSSSGLITPVTPATSTANNFNVLYITSSSTSAALTPSKAKRRSSTGSNKIDINDFLDFLDGDPKTLADVQPYLDGLDDTELPYTNAALVRCFFGFQNVRFAVNSDIHNFFLKVPFFKSKNIKTLKNSINAAIARHPRYFKSVKPSQWEYLLSAVAAEPPRPRKTSESRPYSEAESSKEYAIIWKAGEDGGNVCDLEDYRFKLQIKDCGEYLKCLDCSSLQDRLRNRQWQIGGERYQKPIISSLKLSRDRKLAIGCPWRPAGNAHFCLKYEELNRAIRADLINERMSHSYQRIEELIKQLEAKGEKVMDGFDSNSLPKELQELLEKLPRYNVGQKARFLYIIVKNGKVYIGISGDYEHRLIGHPRGKECEHLFEEERDVTMKVGRLGLLNLLSVMDIEASLIYLKSIHALDNKMELINLGQGNFASQGHILKNIIEDPNNVERALIITAINQLFNELMNSGITVDLNGKGSISAAITDVKSGQKRNNLKLQNYQPTVSSPGASQASQSSQTSQPASFLLESYPQLYEFVDQLRTVHHCHVPMKEAKLYIMAQKGTKIAVRFGTSWDVEQRRDGHIHEGTIGGIFDMYVSPLGEQNLLVVTDLEYVCIKLSKQQAVKFCKENLNSDLDVGRVNSSFLEAIIEQPEHPRRPWLISAVNQLIKCTFANGDTV